jgi:hypothetical protein
MKRVRAVHYGLLAPIITLLAGASPMFREVIPFGRTTTGFCLDSTTRPRS